MVINVTNEMFTKKSHQDVKKSSVKIQDSKKDSATRLKHLKIVLEHFDVEEAKNYFETNFSHVYFILYDNFIQAENNLRQRELSFHLVHKAGREELEGALSLLERVLCLLPELLAKRWQLHSLTRIFSKLLHTGNSQKLRAEAIRYFLLWYQALGDNAPVEVHRMFASLVPGLPEPQLLPSGSPISPRPFDLGHPGSNDIDIKQIMQHPNFSSANDTPSKKEASDNNHSPGIMGKLVNVSASIFHDLNILNPVQCVEIHPLLPPGGNEKAVENETKYFLEMLLDGMATSVVRVHWKDRSHSKAMRNFAFLLEKFKMYYLPCICPQFDYNNSLYAPNLEVPVQHTILEDEFVQCRVSLIKWVASYVHAARRGGSEQSATQPSSLGSQPAAPTGHHDETETSFSHAPHAGGDSASSTPHPSLDSMSNTEEISSTAVVRDVLNWSREHVDFTLEVLRQAFLLPFSQSTAIRRVITLYKDWIQMNVSDVPPFLLESASYSGEYQPSAATGGVAPAHHQLSVPDAPVPAPRRLRNDSYLGAIHKDNPLVRIGLQNVLQVFMTQAANVFVASPSPVAPPGGLGQQQLLDEQTDTCKRVLNIYRYMVMHTPMDANTWEQLLLVLLQITSLVLTKVPPKRKHESLGGSLAPAIFQTLIVTWIKANLNVAVRPELWQSFMDVLGKLTHWEDLIKEWAKTMETLTRVLARHVYGLDLSELPLERAAEGARRGVRRAPARAAVTAGPVAAPAQPVGKSSKTAQEFRKALSSSETSRRSLSRCRSDPHLSSTSPPLSTLQTDSSDYGKSPKLTKPRRCHSLDSLRNTHLQEDRDSESGTRSPSPAPSSGVESSSIKDSPLQIDLASDGGNVEWSSEDSNTTPRGSARGVVCGGTARGWLPDVAAVLWRRMLAALGDPNNLRDPALHAHLFHYLLHLNDTLVKISANQSLNGNTETHVPFNLVAGWCLQAEALPQTHRQGKLLALRLLCCSTNATNPGGPQQCANRLHLAHLHLYHRALHHGLTGEDRNVVDVLIKHAAPRYLSLALDGHSLLLLDFVHASTVVLNSTDIGPNCPRTEAVTFLGSLLSLPDSLMNAPMLQPYPHQYTTVSCPDLKEHVLNIVIRVCRREPAARARCGGALALAAHCHRLLATRTHSERLPQCVLNLLQMLTMKNRNIAKVVSDVILLLSDYTDRIMEQYPDLAGKIVWWICSCLAQLGRAGARDAVLAGVLLQALAEYCCRMGLQALMQPAPGSKDTLLLIVFKVLYAVMSGTNGSDIEGLSLKVDEDFDPNIQLDNMGPKTLSAATIDIKLWAQMVCSQLVLWLGHWPLWGSWQLSSEVSEQHDGRGAELGAAVLRADNLQLLRLADSTLASLLELPALPSPAGCIAPGLVTCEKQVRIILRDLAGKACWDASALHYDPHAARQRHDPPRPVPTRRDEPSPRDVILSSLPPPYTPDKLPDYQLSPPTHHQLDNLLQYIGHTSPEVLQQSGQRLDAAGPSPLPPGAEDEVIALLVSQRNAERDYRARSTQHDIATETPTPADTTQLDNGSSPPLPFQQCRLFLSQFGALAWGRRKSVQLMKRSERLIRELKNLDSQRCRETHKVAVIYVARGQENRNDILANRCGSPAYESFLAALAWEVELESHVGFSGGLQRGGPGGVTAPYVATLTLEALFHVATRMPSNTPEAILNKTRHLGNDEVHVVWSEHWRAYRRDTLPTQFCDVLIALYPLPGGLLRCTLTRKQDVPMFGPLAEESVVSIGAAAGLVRAAALAGGRAVRATMPLYRHAHAERAAALAALCGPHAQPTTFEAFVRLLREPVDQQRAEASGGTLAAALLDHGATQQLGNWSTEPHSVSPRPLKRLGHFKRPQATTPPATPHVSAPRKNR